jgi:hypothetical protein
MKTMELLKDQLEFSKLMTATLLADMRDAPLTSPTPRGGNHPLWIAGHLVYSEARITNEIMFGKPAPLADWKELFRGGSRPLDDAGRYPLTLPETLAMWDKIRAETLEMVDGLTDEELECPSAKCPPGREAVFGTFGKALSMVVMHPLMHRGQVADARRTLLRRPLMA